MLIKSAKFTKKLKRKYLAWSPTGMSFEVAC